MSHNSLSIDRTIDQETHPVSLTLDQMQICLIALHVYDMQLRDPLTHDAAKLATQSACRFYGTPFDLHRLDDPQKFGDAGIGLSADQICDVYYDAIESHLSILAGSDIDEPQDDADLIRQLHDQEVSSHEHA